MNKKMKALKAAFPHTIPIFAGFSFLGLAYGIFMNTKGFNFIWTLVMSSTIFAGSMEFVTANLLLSTFQPIYVFVLTLMINARHLFYGISMLEKFKGTGKKKAYLIFGMCDETFSILCSTEPPEGVDKGWFMFFVTLLNYSYWVISAVIGNIIGSFIMFDTKGIDFVMTALFTVIFIDQWRNMKNHLPALVGVGASVICLLLFGQGGFIIPSMGLILFVLTVLKKPLEKEIDL